MANENKIDVQISASINELTKGLNEAVSTVQTKMNDIVSVIQTSYANIAGALYIFEQAWHKVSTMVNEGIKAERVEQVFRSMSVSANINADEMLEAMKRATLGTVEDHKLMQAANKALAMDLSQEKITNLWADARVIARASGQSIEEAFGGISRAVEMNYLRPLMHAGLLTRQEMMALQKEINSGTSGLTAYSIIQAVVAERGNKVGDMTEDNVDKMAQFDASLKQLEEAFGKLVASAIIPFIQKLTEVIDNLEKMAKHPVFKLLFVTPKELGEEVKPLKPKSERFGDPEAEISGPPAPVPLPKSLETLLPEKIKEGVSDELVETYRKNLDLQKRNNTISALDYQVKYTNAIFEIQKIAEDNAKRDATTGKKGELAKAQQHAIDENEQKAKGIRLAAELSAVEAKRSAGLITQGEALTEELRINKEQIKAAQEKIALQVPPSQFDESGKENRAYGLELSKFHVQVETAKKQLDELTNKGIKLKSQLFEITIPEEGTDAFAKWMIQIDDANLAAIKLKESMQQISPSESALLQFDTLKSKLSYLTKEQTRQVTEGHEWIGSSTWLKQEAEITKVREQIQKLRDLLQSLGVVDIDFNIGKLKPNTEEWYKWQLQLDELGISLVKLQETAKDISPSTSIAEQYTILTKKVSDLTGQQKLAQTIPGTPDWIKTETEIVKTQEQIVGLLNQRFDLLIKLTDQYGKLGIETLKFDGNEVAAVVAQNELNKTTKEYIDLQEERKSKDEQVKAYANKINTAREQVDLNKVISANVTELSKTTDIALNPLNSALDAIIMKTQSVSEAFKKMWQSIASTVLNKVLKGIESDLVETTAMQITGGKAAEGVQNYDWMKGIRKEFGAPMSEEEAKKEAIAKAGLSPTSIDILGESAKAAADSLKTLKETIDRITSTSIIPPTGAAPGVAEKSPVAAEAGMLSYIQRATIETEETGAFLRSGYAKTEPLPTAPTTSGDYLTTARNLTEGVKGLDESLASPSPVKTGTESVLTKLPDITKNIGAGASAEKTPDSIKQITTNLDKLTQGAPGAVPDSIKTAVSAMSTVGKLIPPSGSSTVGTGGAGKPAEKGVLGTIESIPGIGALVTKIVNDFKGPINDITNYFSKAFSTPSPAMEPVVPTEGGMSLASGEEFTPINFFPEQGTQSVNNENSSVFTNNENNYGDQGLQQESVTPDYGGGGDNGIFGLISDLGSLLIKGGQYIGKAGTGVGAGVAAAAPVISAGTEGMAVIAAGGFDVPKDTFTMLHAKEMVLPANLAEKVRNMSTISDRAMNISKVDLLAMQDISKGVHSKIGTDYAVTLPSAAGGYDVPTDQLVKVHAREMILPTSLADKVRDGVDSGTVNHYNVSITAMDTQGVRDFFDGNSDHMMDAMHRKMKNFG